MSFARQFWLRLRTFFRRNRATRRLDSELQFHLDQQIVENIAAGMSPEEARRAARLLFGNSAALRETTRDTWGFRWLEQFFQDARYALRTLRKSPGFTVVAILTLALGIGANSAIFSLVNAVLLQPLPYTQPDRLVRITDAYPEGAFVALRESTKSMEVAAYREGVALNLTGLGEPRRLYGMEVSSNFFSLLGVRAEFGRTFLDGEDQSGRDDLVILSRALWQQEFASDPNVIGRPITLEGRNRRIVGVMPSDFDFGSPRTQFWIPLDLDPREVGAYWGGGFMPLIARLRPGLSLEQARAEFRAAIPQLRSLFPWRMPDALWAASSVVPLERSIVGELQGKLLILLAAVGLVLMLACVNVTNLLLARAATRKREMSVRAALGAGRSRICRQVLTESVLLAFGGAALGLLLAFAGLAWLKTIFPADTPRLAAATIDWRVLAFAAAVAVLTGVLFGLAPALEVSKIDLSNSLKAGWQHCAASNRTRHALAVAEIAVAAVLVIGAGLLVKSLWELSHINPGFCTESIVSARVTPNESSCADFARCRNFYNELLQRVRSLPGVLDAAVVNMLPLAHAQYGLAAFAADLEDHPRNKKDPAPVILETVITPDYLRLMGIPLLRGRAFMPGDMAPGAPPVALVTLATAQKYWPNQNPVGKHVKPVFDKAWTTIVGVVGDVNVNSLAMKWPDAVDGAIYEPYGNGRGKLLPAEMTLVVKMADPASFVVLLRRTVAGLSPDVPVSDARTLRAVVSESMAAPRSMMSLFAIFAALALGLAALGIYGVISYSVVQRTAEIGMRKALGAQNREVMRLVMERGVRSALWGVGIGLLAALMLTRLLQSLLYGISSLDPLTFLAAPVALICVALLACYVPARRAMRVDPMTALRHE
jgi:predicted permease